MTPDEPLDLAELSARADVSPRTIRYYIQQGLLPSPEARGPGAHYGPEHLDRLNLIRQLQREHLPLAEIRRRIESLSPDEIRRLLEQTPKRSPTAAKDYIRAVLNEGPAASVHPSVAQAKEELFARHFVKRAPMPMGDPEPPTSPSTPTKTTRSQWDRITLAPDVELHIRRPLAREQNRQVERLLEAARAIYEENKP